MNIKTSDVWEKVKETGDDSKFKEVYYKNDSALLCITYLNDGSVLINILNDMELEFADSNVNNRSLDDIIEYADENDLWEKI